MTQQLKTTALAIALASIVVCLPQRGVAQDAKIAVVNTRVLTLMSDEGKVASDKLQKRIDVIRVEMDKLRKDIEEKDNNLRTRERLLSSQAKAAAQKDIDDDKFKFEQKAQIYQKEMDEMQSSLLEPVHQKVQVELQSYVSEKAYTLVIDVADETNVVWANPGNDITRDVMARVNENFKRSGGVAPAPAAAPKPAAPTPPAATPPAGQRGTATPPATTTPAPTTPAPGSPR